MIDWKIVYTIHSIKSVFAAPDSEAEVMGSAEATQLDDFESDRKEVSEEWHEVSMLNEVGEDFRAICVHQCQTYLKKAGVDGDVALDSSGRISSEFIHFLADKYEAAANTDTEMMRNVEPQRLSSGYLGHSVVQKPDFVSQKPLFELSTATMAQGNLVTYADPQMDGHTIDDPENSLSTDRASGDPSPKSSEVNFPRRSLRDDNGVEIDVEDFLEDLLGKRSSLAEEGGLTEEDDLILNTAWNMAQAIVYQSTPRPSLEEISEQGYWTAPTTPLPSGGGGHSNSAPSSYSTPRAISPVSFVLDLHQ